MAEAALSPTPAPSATGARRPRALQLLTWLFFAGALVFAAIAAALGDEFYFRLATEALIFGGLALAVDVLLGRTGLLPLGHALFFGFGAYVAGLVLKHWAASFWLAIGVVFVTSLVAGVVGGIIAIRARGVYFALISFGLAQVVAKIVFNTRELGASDGIIGIPELRIGFGPLRSRVPRRSRGSSPVTTRSGASHSTRSGAKLPRRKRLSGNGWVMARPR